MIEKTKDFEIRFALKECRYVQKLKREDAATLTLEEFSIISTEARIDLAIFNGHFHGFEIKSDKDTLDRLPHQIDAYNKVFDYLYIVVGEKYLDRVKTVIPKFWGIIVARKTDSIVQLHKERRALINRGQDDMTLSSLLWRDELISLLVKYGVTKGISNNRTALSKMLCEIVPTKQILKTDVRNQIKQRGDWRVVLKQKQCGVKSRPSAKLIHCQWTLPV